MARKIGRRTFRKYHDFDPKDQNQADQMYRYHDGTVHYRWTDTEIRRLVGVYSKTKVPCSCYRCGHRREYEGPTRQEYRELVRFAEGMAEVGLPCHIANLFYGWD